MECHASFRTSAELSPRQTHGISHIGYENNPEGMSPFAPMLCITPSTPAVQHSVACHGNASTTPCGRNMLQIAEPTCRAQAGTKPP